MKYFAVSDIHSFGNLLSHTLDKCGFDKDNPNHTLIVDGDVFDRGNETLEVYNFLKSIPKERCILIRGNHEELYFQLLEKRFPDLYDFSNGTVRTFCDIAGEDPIYTLRDLRDECYRMYNWGEYDVDLEVKKLWDKIRNKVKKSEITKWIKSDQWVNYYEVDKYIFVHSFIPLKYKGERGISEAKAIYDGWTQLFEFIPDWRNADDEQWNNAMWGCPYKFFEFGLFNPEKEKGKILVCGHYRCSEFNNYYLNSETCDIYYGKNLIAIDATTALNLQINVLIIDEDGKCYDQNGLLEYKKPIPLIETVTLDPEEWKKYKNDVTNY